MTDGQDEGQPYQPWQPQPYNPGPNRRRMQEPPQDSPWQQAPYPGQDYQPRGPRQPQSWEDHGQQYPPDAYGQQYPPNGQPWREPGYGQPPGYGQQAAAPPQQSPHEPQGQPWDQSGHSQPPLRPRRKSWLARHKVLAGLIAGAWLVVGIVAIASAGGKGNKSAPPANTPTTSAAVAASAPAAIHKPSYPPTTLADFRAFAATGDASRVHQVAFASLGLPSCPSPAYYVTVSPAVTGRALEADLSAFFVQEGLLGNECHPVVWAFHSKSDYLAHRDDGYTAGRVIVSNTGSGSNLEVDAGDVYNFPAEFDFNF